MKRNTALLLFLLLLSVTAFSQIDPPENNEEKFNKSVQSFNQITYQALDSFGELKKTVINENFFVLVDTNNNPYKATDLNSGNEFFSAKYIVSSNYFERIWKKIKKNKERNGKEYWKYNSTGNIIEYCNYKNDTIEKKEFAEYKNNRLIQYKSYAKDGKLDWQKSFKYDSRGNKIESLNFNIYGYYSHEIHKYDKSNKLILSTSIDKNEKNEYEKTYKYDKNGNLIEETTSYFDNEYKKYNNKKVFQYSLEGYKIAEVRYNNNGIEYDRRTYEYDSKGRLTFEETPYGKHTHKFDSNGNLLEKIDCYYDNEKNIESKSITQYQYDLNGNWIKKTSTYLKSPKLIPEEFEITERKINYR